MKRDFGLHFAAWFLLGIPFLLISAFQLKAIEGWFGPDVSGPEVFCYSFLAILSVSFVCALIDVFIISRIVDRIKNPTV